MTISSASSAEQTTPSNPALVSKPRVMNHGASRGSLINCSLRICSSLVLVNWVTAIMLDVILPRAPSRVLLTQLASFRFHPQHERLPCLHLARQSPSLHVYTVFGISCNFRSRKISMPLFFQPFNQCLVLLDKIVPFRLSHIMIPQWFKNDLSCFASRSENQAQ